MPLSVFLDRFLPLAAGVGLAVLIWPVFRRRAFFLARDLGQTADVTGFRPCRGLSAFAGLAVGVLCAICFSPGLRMWGALLLGLMLFVLAWIDLETHLLPDFLTIPLWLAGLLFNSAGVFASPAQAVLGGLAAWSTFWLAGALYRLWCGRDGLGGGDVKFAAALGSWLGWPQVPLLLLLSAVISLAAWGLLALFGRSSRVQPFGPCLALGGLLLMLTPAI